MWSISPPTDRISSAFALCTSGNQTDLIQRLIASRAKILSASARFVQAVEVGESWRLTAADFTVTGVTGKEMARVYDYYFVQGGARCLYNRIMSQSVLGRCPLCECGNVSTLDHFLPKSVFPALAIDPLNLIPACRDCNHTMQADLATSPDTEHIHPYFWKDEGSWLKGSIVQSDAPFVRFYVQAPPDWTPTRVKRVESHFARLALGRKLAVASASAVREVTLSLAPLIAIGDSELVHSHLVEVAESTAEGFGENYWRTVVLRTLADEEWFWSNRIWGA